MIIRSHTPWSPSAPRAAAPPVPRGDMAEMVDRISRTERDLQAERASEAQAPPRSPESFDPDVNTRPWQDDVIYMALVDRFANGDPSNDGKTDPQDPHARHGGDLRGLIDKLDYLQDLGVTALWIDPVEKNQENGYHGYWPTDFGAVDPHRGTMEELKELRQKANERGIKLILDRVTNHTGYEHPWATDPAKESWFHRGGNIKWMDQHSIEVGALHGLPDFAQENPEVADWLIANDLRWQAEVRPQGYRLDAVKHVPSEFWKKYSAAMHAQGGDNFLLIGEVFRGIPDYIARYQREDGIDSVFDVPLADTIRDTLTHDSEDQGPGILRRTADVIKNRKYLLWNEILRKLWPQDPGDMRNFSRVFGADREYEHPELLATVFDNHDVTRFVTEAGAKGREKLKLALTLLMGARGIPVMLYGTEVAMEGMSGQQNRGDMPFGKDPEMTAFFKKLTALRKDSVALRRGRQVELLADKETYSFARVHEKGVAVVALNNSSEPQTRTLEVASLLPPGTRLHDALSGGTATVRDGRLEVTLQPGQGVILRPQVA